MSQRSAAAAAAETAVMPSLSGDVREAVLRAGLQILAASGLTHGIGQLSHGRLAERAHCGTTTVYRYWPTKAALVRAVLDRLLLTVHHTHTESMRSVMLSAIAQGAALGRLAEDAARAVVATHEARHDIVYAMIAEARYLDPALRERIRDRMVQVRAPAAELFRLLPVVYPLRPVAEDAADRAVRLVHSLARGLLSEPHLTLRDVADPAAALTADLASGMLGILGELHEREPGVAHLAISQVRPRSAGA